MQNLKVDICAHTKQKVIQQLENNGNWLCLHGDNIAEDLANVFILENNKVGIWHVINAPIQETYRASLILNSCVVKKINYAADNVYILSNDASRIPANAILRLFFNGCDDTVDGLMNYMESKPDLYSDAHFTISPEWYKLNLNQPTRK